MNLPLLAREFQRHILTILSHQSLSTSLYFFCEASGLMLKKYYYNVYNFTSKVIFFVCIFHTWSSLRSQSCFYNDPNQDNTIRAYCLYQLTHIKYSIGGSTSCSSKNNLYSGIKHSPSFSERPFHLSVLIGALFLLLEKLTQPVLEWGGIWRKWGEREIINLKKHILGSTDWAMKATFVNEGKFNLCRITKQV